MLLGKPSAQWRSPRGPWGTDAGPGAERQRMELHLDGTSALGGEGLPP